MRYGRGLTSGRYRNQDESNKQEVKGRITKEREFVVMMEKESREARTNS